MIFFGRGASADADEIPQPVPAPPLPTWEAVADTEGRRHEACRWLAACTIRPHPHEKRKGLGVFAADHRVGLGDLVDADVVTVGTQEINRWYPVDMDRTVLLGHERLNGLFGFAQAVLWPRWMNDWQGRRLLLEPDLAPDIAAAVERYREARASLRKAFRADIERLLAMDRHARHLYHAVEAEDPGALRSGHKVWMRHDVGVLPEHVDEYIAFLEAGDRANVRARKQHLFSCICMRLLQARIASADFSDWQSAEYHAADEQLTAKGAELARIGGRLYAGLFRALLLRDDIQALEEDLFAGSRLPGSRPYRDLVEQLASWRRPLSEQEQMR